MQQLVPASIVLTGPQAYAASPPYPSVLVPSPTLALVAVTAARSTGSVGPTTMLDPTSVVDLTANVDGSGYFTGTCPMGTGFCSASGSGQPDR